MLESGGGGMKPGERIKTQPTVESDPFKCNTMFGLELPPDLTGYCSK